MYLPIIALIFAEQNDFVIECLTSFFHFYNRERIHQSLEYRTPEAVYRGVA